MKYSSFLILMLSCGLEGPLVNLVMKDKSTEVPEAAPNYVYGVILNAPIGTPVHTYAGSGTSLPEISTVIEEDGRFRLTFPGNTEFAGVRIEAKWQGGQVFGILPLSPRQQSVMDPERHIQLGAQIPRFQYLSCESTAFTLILMGKAMADGKTLSSLSPEVLKKTISSLGGLRDSNNPNVVAFVDLIQKMCDLAGSNNLYPFLSETPQGTKVGDLLNEDFRAKFFPDLTKMKFEEMLLSAADEVKVAICYDQTKIRVVFLCDFRDGTKDGNCNPINKFKWATDKPGKTMFLAAGVHETTPICGGELQKPFCITEEELDYANNLLGNWVPNKVQMYDDGTHGDAVKGDRIFTLVVDLPYIPLANSPHNKGMRIGYKYTWGMPGANWPETEEWPGNSRLLELVDVNGDGLVVRMDAFGDEATNKDFMNSLTPANGGCGINVWEDQSASKPKCAHDTRERKVDTDGDCKPDAWPSPGSVTPLTVECE